MVIYICSIVLYDKLQLIILILLLLPLVALANGGILELPWMMVDPRRPINPEMREEGVIPYMPEIPIHMDAIINYNQSVSRVLGIHTSPSGLESTCLVFVHGLGKCDNYIINSKNIFYVNEQSNNCCTCRFVLYESGTI